MKNILSLVSATNSHLSDSKATLGAHEVFMVRDYVLKIMGTLGMNYSSKEASVVQFSNNESVSNSLRRLLIVFRTKLELHSFLC